MNKIIKVNGNELSIDSKTIKFKYDIRDTKVVNNQVILYWFNNYKLKRKDTDYKYINYHNWLTFIDMVKFWVNTNI